MERLKSLKANTVKHDHAYIRNALQAAFMKGIIPSNPADMAVKPKVDPYFGKYYNSEELAKLFKCAEGKEIELSVLMAS